MPQQFVRGYRAVPERSRMKKRELLPLRLKKQRGASSFEYLRPVGTDADHAYRTADKLLKALDVVLTVYGKLVKACTL